MKFQTVILGIGVLCLTLYPNSAHSQSNSGTLSDSATPTPSSASLWKEIGVSVGSPSGVNLVVGSWGTARIPLLVRVSGMYYGSTAKGIQGDLGWAFQQSGNFKQYVALTGLTFEYSGIAQQDVNWTGIGPSYGFNFHGFMAQLGPSFGSGQHRDDSARQIANLSWSLMGQIGYSILW